MSLLSLGVCLPAIASSIQAETHMDSMRRISAKLMAERNSQQAAAKLLKDAGVKPGKWRRIGPFRDQGPHLNWMTNVEAGALYVYDVEKDALANGGLPKLTKEYPGPNFPATPKAVRVWTTPPDWIDGYYQQLPRGPAPSAGETQYVYREIIAAKAVTVEIDCIIRAPEADRRMGDYGMEPWRRTGRYTWWVNGKEVQKWGGRNTRGDMPQKAKVELKQGKNHFLAKFTNNRHAYGFAFSLYGMHPDLHHERGFEGVWRPLQINKTTDLPFYREPSEPPKWFVKKSGWLSSLVASRDKCIEARGNSK